MMPKDKDRLTSEICKTTSAYRPRGFTVIELVTVILLLGILSATAFSRLNSGNTTEQTRLAAQITRLTHLAQQGAMSRSDAVTRLNVAADANSWLLSVVQVNGGTTVATLYSGSVPRDDVALALSDGTLTGAVSVGASLQVDFDVLGDLAAVRFGASPANSAAGIELVLSDDRTQTLCLYPTGVLGEGVCV